MGWVRRLRATILGGTIDRGFDEEARFHFEARVDEFVRQGLPLADARREAARRLGNLTVAKEQVRDVDTLRWVTDVRNDVRDAVRSLRRNPGFAMVAIMTLALVMGANAGIFSVLDAIMLRRLPVRHPEKLVQVSTVFRTNPRLEGALSLPMFKELQRGQQVFSTVLGWWGSPILAVEADDGLTSGAIWGVTGDFFAELGISPFAGRLLTIADVDLESFIGAPAAVLGHGFWQRHFGGDPHAIGRLVRIEGIPFTIVGVSPPGFKALGFTTDVDVTVPLPVYPRLFRTGGVNFDYLRAGNVLWMRATGRLKSGVTLEQARAQLTALWPSVQAVTIPPTYAGAQRENFLSLRLAVRSAATGWDSGLRSTFARPLVVVMSVSLLMLLVACVNLASLMLSRTVARHGEIAMRAALGASRWRLARHVLTEGVLLSAAGALCSVWPAYWISSQLGRMMWPDDSPVPLALDTAPGAQVLGCTAFVAVAVGLLFSLVPAWRATRLPGVVLPRSAPTATRSASVGKLLVGGQLALSLMLLLATGLFVRTVQQLQAIDLAFDTDGVTMARLYQKPSSGERPDDASYFRALIARVMGLPGVSSASVAKGGIGSPAFAQPVSPMSWSPSDGIPSALEGVSPAFFQSLGVRILQGRDIAWNDRGGMHKVVILSRNLAARLFPDRDAIGQHVRIGTQEDRQHLEVVGIVDDARLWDVRDPVSYAAFVPVLQQEHATTNTVLFVRNRHLNDDELRRAVESVGPDYVVTANPLNRVVSAAIRQERMTAQLAASFGALTLMLAAVGVFGVTSYTVTQRTKEIAIRLALGAGRVRMVRFVAREGASIALGGCAVGLAGSLPIIHLMRTLLFGVSPYDPTVLMVAPILLMFTTIVACVIPVMHAARVDPAATLRAE